MTSEIRPRTNIDDARTTIVAVLLALAGGHWNDPETQDYGLIPCPICGQLDGCQLRPLPNGDIEALCLTNAGCKPAALSKAMWEHFGVRLKAPKPVRVKPTDGLVDVPPEEVPDYFDDNSNGDAWRLVQMHGSRLLAVNMGQGQWPETYVLNMANGVWERNLAELERMHTETSKQSAVNVSLLAYDGKLRQQRSIDLQKWLLKHRHTADVAEIARQVLSVTWEMDARGIPHGVTTARVSELDAHRRYIGTASGIVDLDTTDLLAVDEGRLLLVTRSTGIEYDPQARHPAIDALLAHLRDEDRDYLLDAVGYALRGNPAGRWYLLSGPRRSGKTTFLRAISAALGKAGRGGYAYALTPGALLNDRNANPNAHTEHLKHFHHTRIAYASELPEGKNAFNVGLLKLLTGGDDLPLRGIYDRFGVEMPAGATIFQALNPGDVERLDLKDDALEIRSKILPWPDFPAGTHRDTERIDTVSAPDAAKAMLAVLIERAAANYSPPDDIQTIADAVEQRRQESLGRLGQWFQDRLVVTDLAHDMVTPDTIWETAYMDLDGREGRIDGLDRRGALSLMRSSVARMPAQKKQRGGNGKRPYVYPGVRLLGEDETLDVESVPENHCPECGRVNDGNWVPDERGRCPVCRLF